MAYSKHLFRFICAVALFISGGANAADSQDFLAFAAKHCNALVATGNADMQFALGKAAAKFSQAELAEFNHRFAQKLVEEYRIDRSAGCVLDMVNTGTVQEPAGNKPKNARNRKPEAELERAIVSGVMQGQAKEPVAVAYRLERRGSAPWEIVNISMNGQPLVDRYREEYEAAAGQGGAEAVLEDI